MSSANPKPRPMPNPNPKSKLNPKPKPSSQPSSSAAAAVVPNSHGNPPASASTPPNPNPNPTPAPIPVPPHLHPALAPSPAPHPLPPPRPLLTVAAVEAVMASLPPPPQYGLQSLERRAIALSGGTVRSYFVLPPDPRPPRHLPPQGPPAGPPKRKWEEHFNSNGQPLGESSGRLEDRHAANQVWPEVAEGRHPAKQAKAEATEDRHPGKQANMDSSVTSTIEVDEKALKSAFLKMVKVINESALKKKNYQGNGKFGPLKCVVCARESRDFVDLHSLINHAYNAKNVDQRADHLGLHKALCVLMGWNYLVDPVNKKAYQTLSSADAEANQGDLILWPPTVILENTYKLKKDGPDGIGNKEMESKLKDMGFPGVKAKGVYGKEGHRGVALVKFASSQAGLDEAMRLAELLEEEGHGRQGLARARDSAAAADGSNPMLTKVDEKTGERTWVFYGYLATAWDLHVLDVESKKKVVVKSRKEPDLSC